MYTFKRSIIRYVTGPMGLIPLDVSSIPLNAFYKYFKEAIVVLEDSLYKSTVSIRYTDYQAAWSAYAGTIQQWLNDNASTVLKTYEEFPQDVYRTVTLHDIQYEWFSLLPGDVSQSSRDQDLININDAPDIRVHKTNNSPVDYDTLHKSTLWLMNNHVVRSVADESNIYLVNAGKHFKVNTNTHVCCMNFKGVGEITQTPITDSDVMYVEEGSSRYLKVRYKEAIKDKTVWMVIGGRLYMSDVISQTDDNAVMVNITKVDWFEKIFTSREWIDLTRVIKQDVVGVGPEFFQTEEFFRNLLTDASSFFVVIDNPNLVVTHIPVGEYHFPFTFYTERKEKLPLLLSNGLMPKYSLRKHVDKRLLDIDAGLHKRFVFHSSGLNNGGLYHGAVNLAFSERYNRGYLLEIKALLQ